MGDSLKVSLSTLSWYVFSHYDLTIYPTIKNRKEVNMSKTRYVEHARDARTGRYVPMSFAVKHPSITVIERDKIKK